MTDRELMQMALDALETYGEEYMHGVPKRTYVKALRARLTQPEPEPVAYLCENAVGHKYFRWKKPPSTYKPIALYTAPPQREWVGLTDDEILEEYRQSYGDDGNLTDVYFAHAIEAKLKEKNSDDS